MNNNIFFKDFVGIIDLDTKLQKNRMFYDLYISKTSTHEGTIAFKQLLQEAVQQGYTTVAVNTSFVDYALTQKQMSTYQTIPVTVPQDSNNLSSTQSHTLTQLSRVTLDVSETRYLQQVNETNKIVASYDIIAVKPKNQKIFHSVCIEYDFYDIITFDMGEKIPFMLKRNPVYQAIRRGKYFELTYSNIYDLTKKRVCLTNFINIIKATKGKNLILSSETSQSLFHRSGYDLVSLLMTLGLKRDEAMRCLRDNPEQCIKSARNRKTYKGVISIATEEQIKIAKDKRLLKLMKMQKKIKQKEQRNHNKMQEEQVLQVKAP